jgi:hypothetical protein
VKKFKVGVVCKTDIGIFKIVSYNDKDLVPYGIKWISGLNDIIAVSSEWLYYNAKILSHYNTKLGKILYK